MTQSAQGQLTRRQIYDRIRQASKDEYLLEEMVRLGFWSQEKEKPSPPAPLVEHQNEFKRELHELLVSQESFPDDSKPVLKIKDGQSHRKRPKNKIKRMRQAHAKTLAWYSRCQKEILFVGHGYSGGLCNTHRQSEKLERLHLPDLPDAAALAEAMGICLAELRFLTFSRPVSTVNHYRRFEIIKKTGGTRLISAPMPRLKRVQYWILENLLNKITLPDAVHGFVGSRSILTNAKPHVGAKVVINMDLKDFFPTITYPRIKGLYQALGYSEQVATLLALMCSEPETDKVQLGDKVYFVNRGLRFLPQGAPTSPAISNILCCRMDRRLSGMASKLGCTYTRYADDLTYSSTNAGHHGNLQKLLWRTRQITTAEGFAVNDAKTRIMHQGRRQEVTGIVVNQKLSVDRKTLKRFRALLFQIEKDGPQGKSWGRGGHIFEVIHGYANFIKMVDPVKGRKYMEKVRHLRQQYHYHSPGHKPCPLSKQLFRQKAAAGQLPRDNWWQVTRKPEPPALILPNEKSPPPVRQFSQFTRIMGYLALIFGVVVCYKISPILVVLITMIYLFRRF